MNSSTAYLPVPLYPIGISRHAQVRYNQRVERGNRRTKHSLELLVRRAAGMVPTEEDHIYHVKTEGLTIVVAAKRRKLVIITLYEDRDLPASCGSARAESA